LRCDHEVVELTLRRDVHGRIPPRLRVCATCRTLYA
jgi:hypothetical protein